MEGDADPPKVTAARPRRHNPRPQRAVVVLATNAAAASAAATSAAMTVQKKTTDTVTDRTKISSGDIRVGSLNDISGSYGRWHHLDCWRGTCQPKSRLKKTNQKFLFFSFSTVTTFASFVVCHSSLPHLGGIDGSYRRPTSPDGFVSNGGNLVHRGQQTVARANVFVGTTRHGQETALGQTDQPTQQQTSAQLGTDASSSTTRRRSGGGSQGIQQAPRCQRHDGRPCFY
jgi:hypothetical protein